MVECVPAALAARSIKRAMALLAAGREITLGDMRELVAHLEDAHRALVGGDDELAGLSDRQLRSLFDPATLKGAEHG